MSNEITSTSEQNLPVPTNRPWLVAGWPGMGNVGLIAAGTIVNQRGLKAATEVDAEGVFENPTVAIKDGVIGPMAKPRSVFYSNPGARPTGHPIIGFIADAQPSNGHAAFAKAIVEHAVQLGVERIVTFASMPARMHPAARAKVFGAATDEAGVKELKRLDVEIIENGQIGGQCGLVLAAAAERGIPGMCLMGEIPFYAPGVPNPGAAKVVLQTFSNMHGVRLNYRELDKHAESVKSHLLELLGAMNGDADDDSDPMLDGERGREEFRHDADAEAADAGSDTSAGDVTEPAPPLARRRGITLDPHSIAHIESLFDAARNDRSQAAALKVELDRLKAFKQYENRFLDLFTQH